MSLHRPSGKWRRRLLIAAGVLLFCAAAFRWVVGKIILAKLAGVVQERLHAQLSADLVYDPPYTLTARNVRLQMERGRLAGDDIDVPEIRIVLGGLPISGTIKIREIRIRQPVLHILHSADRLNDLANLSGNGQSSTAPKGRISDQIRLGHLSIEGGKIVLENGSATGETEINLDVSNSSATMPGAYAITLSAGDPAAAVSLHAQGNIDLDDRSGSLESLVLVAETSELDSPTLPDGIRKFLADYRPSGPMRVDASGAFDGQDSRKNRLAASVDLRHLHGYSPELDLPIDDLYGVLRAQADYRGAVLGIKDFSMHVGGTQFSLDTAAASVVNGMVDLTELRGMYGADQFTLAAMIPQSQMERGDVRLNDLDATIDFHPPSPVYPDSVQDVFTSLRPSGPFHVTGWFDAPVGKRSDYDLQISTDGGALKLVSRNMDMTAMKAQAELLSDHLVIKNLDTQALGGELSGAGQVQTHRPDSYTGNLVLHGADLAQVVAVIGDSDANQTTYKGVTDLSATFAGSGKEQGKSAADLLTAQGQFEVSQGDLWSIPVLQSIAQRFSIVRKALTVSRAAAYFQVQDRTVQLQDAALSSTAIGLQGSGTVDFDGNLDLDIVAAPMADWQARITRTGVPIISGVVGGVVGGVQKILTATTGQLIYRFHVTGTMSQPQLHTVPAPILTVNAAKLFDSMVNPSSRSLLDSLEGPSTLPSTEPATESSTEPASAPATEPATEPTTIPATEPAATEIATQPAQTATRSATSP
jgi:hypothetical protein